MNKCHLLLFFFGFQCRVQVVVLFLAVHLVFCVVIFIVARMQCGPSKLLEYHRHAPNIPSTGYKRSNPYKMFEGGEIVYDKDGVPADTTKNIVEAFDS